MWPQKTRHRYKGQVSVALSEIHAAVLCRHVLSFPTWFPHLPDHRLWDPRWRHKQYGGPWYTLTPRSHGWCPRPRSSWGLSWSGPVGQPGHNFRTPHDWWRKVIFKARVTGIHFFVIWRSVLGFNTINFTTHGFHEKGWILLFIIKCYKG